MFELFTCDSMNDKYTLLDIKSIKKWHTGILNNFILI